MRIIDHLAIVQGHHMFSQKGHTLWHESLAIVHAPSQLPDPCFCLPGVQMLNAQDLPYPCTPAQPVSWLGSKSHITVVSVFCCNVTTLQDFRPSTYHHKAVKITGKSGQHTRCLLNVSESCAKALFTTLRNVRHQGYWLPPYDSGGPEFMTVEPKRKRLYCQGKGSTDWSNMM